MLQFISRHCDQWVPGRRWRIFMLDAYSAHMTSTVREHLKSRGYVLVHHGGGVTGAVQVTDTHEHLPFSLLYQIFEMQDMIDF